MSFSANVSYALPAATALIETASVGRIDAMSPAPPTPIVPALGPVGSPLVTLGTAPTISWFAPTIGVPTRYRVDIYALQAVGTPLTTVRALVATWTTGATQVTLPAGLLQTGVTYYARITAYASAGDSFATAPYRQANVGSWAETLTTTFTP